MSVCLFDIVLCSACLCLRHGVVLGSPQLIFSDSKCFRIRFSRTHLDSQFQGVPPIGLRFEDRLANHLI